MIFSRKSVAPKPLDDFAPPRNFPPSYEIQNKYRLINSVSDNFTSIFTYKLPISKFNHYQNILLSSPVSGTDQPLILYLRDRRRTDSFQRDGRELGMIRTFHVNCRLDDADDSLHFYRQGLHGTLQCDKPAERV